MFEWWDLFNGDFTVLRIRIVDWIVNSWSVGQWEREGEVGEMAQMKTISVWQSKSRGRERDNVCDTWSGILTRPYHRHLHLCIANQYIVGRHQNFDPSQWHNLLLEPSRQRAIKRDRKMRSPIYWKPNSSSSGRDSERERHCQRKKAREQPVPSTLLIHHSGRQISIDFLRHFTQQCVFSGLFFATMTRMYVYAW